MKKINWKSATVIVASILVIVAILLSAWAWCLSDDGLPIIQRHFMRNYDQLKWGPVSLTYTEKWIVETVSRPEDGTVLVYGFWASGKNVSPKTASLGLKLRDTGEQISVVMTPVASDKASPDNYGECLRTEKCRATQSFLGLNTPNIVVPVDGGEWVVLEHFAASVLVLNPRHVDLSDIRLQPTNSSIK